jgi:hypothetical protein
VNAGNFKLCEEAKIVWGAAYGWAFNYGQMRRLVILKKSGMKLHGLKYS